MRRISKGAVGKKSRRETIGSYESRRKEGKPEYWKVRLGYNMRWTVEGMFSLFKRLLGEHATALKWRSIKQEILPNIALYNK